jgi:hypothetical protein
MVGIADMGFFFSGKVEARQVRSSDRCVVSAAHRSRPGGPGRTRHAVRLEEKGRVSGT